MPYDLSDLMQLVCAERADAVHVHEREAPVLEVKRMLHRLEGPPVAPGEAEQLLRTVAPAEELSELRTNRISSFYFHFRDIAVFHVMAFHEDDSVRLELRRFR